MQTRISKNLEIHEFFLRILKWRATNFPPTNQHLLLVLLDVVAVGRCERRCPWLSATDSHWRRSGRCMMCSAGTWRLHRRRQRSRRCLYLGLLRRAVTRLHYADYKRQWVWHSNTMNPRLNLSVTRTTVLHLFCRMTNHTHTHTHTHLTDLFQGLPGWAVTRKVK